MYYKFVSEFFYLTLYFIMVIRKIVCNSQYLIVIPKYTELSGFTCSPV